MNPDLRYLWVYSAANQWTLDWNTRLLEERRKQGYAIKGFCTTIPYLDGRWLPFPELDQRWRSGDRALMAMYQRLVAELQDCNVLVLYNGANLHPEFVSWLNVLKVYTAGDDPESTEILSKPLAPAFDIHLVNNAACVEMYQSWGLKKVYFWPLGSLTGEEETADLNEDNILKVGNRPVPFVFFGERTSTRRHERLEQLALAFPQAYSAGKGWPRGFVDWEEMWAVYRRSQIGWNLHNSTGPVNFRTYELPAYGVMQICDNKSTLGRVYQPGVEAVGFDTIEDAIEASRYYLAHPEEQRAIALAGWKRWKKDYTPQRVWDRLAAIVEENWTQAYTDTSLQTELIQERLRRQARRSSWYGPVLLAQKALGRLGRGIRGQS